MARDYRSREMEAIYGAEGTARIGLALERLLAGLETLGMDRKKALAVVEAVALDSVPPQRRREIFPRDEFEQPRTARMEHILEN